MKTIAMILPTTDNSFFSSLVHYVEKYLSEQNVHLLICDSHNSSNREKEYLDKLSKICDGILDVSGLSELSEDLLPENYPLVFVDRKPICAKTIPWVGNDDKEAMKEATDFLIKKGCKNILLLPGYIAEKQNEPRVHGYKEALEKASIPFDESYVINRKGEKSSEIETQEILLSIMKEAKVIDAIITSSDRAAFGVIRALNLLGYYVPEDIRLIAFDNSIYSTYASPSITSIDRNSKQIAEKACKLILDKIDGKEVQLETTIPVSLVIKDSTR